MLMERAALKTFDVDGCIRSILCIAISNQGGRIIDTIQVLNRNTILPSKIKTIGDSNIYAGGLPSPNLINPLEVVLAAIEIKTFMHQLKEIKIKMTQTYWKLYIGIHKGVLIARVVGKRKFAYYICGDTVNSA